MSLYKVWEEVIVLRSKEKKKKMEDERSWNIRRLNSLHSLFSLLLSDWIKSSDRKRVWESQWSQMHEKKGWSWHALDTRRGRRMDDLWIGDRKDREFKHEMKIHWWSKERNHVDYCISFIHSNWPTFYSIHSSTSSIQSSTNANGRTNVSFSFQ